MNIAIKTEFLQSTRRFERAVTLVEMLVATTLLVVIMLGLTTMFTQTQRAFKSGLKQTDVFEGGRSVMDLMERDVEQLAPSKTIADWSLFSGIQIANNYLINEQASGGGDLRTNVLHSMFLLNHFVDWTAIGYRVLDPDNPNDFTTLKVGTLYRFSTNSLELHSLNLPDTTNSYYHLFYGDYISPSDLITNGYLSRVIDGVVHFEIKYYDTGGHLITNDFLPNREVTYVGGSLPDQRLVGFRGDGTNSLPGLVEIEIGIVEPQTLQQWRSLGTGLRDDYLKKQSGHIHIFRQQIPIRNAPR